MSYVGPKVIVLRSRGPDRIFGLMTDSKKYRVLESLDSIFQWRHVGSLCYVGISRYTWAPWTL